jgi:hypothetical protein
LDPEIVHAEIRQHADRGLRQLALDAQRRDERGGHHLRRDDHIGIDAADLLQHALPEPHPDSLEHGRTGQRVRDVPALRAARQCRTGSRETAPGRTDTGRASCGCPRSRCGWRG